MERIFPDELQCVLVGHMVVMDDELYRVTSQEPGWTMLVNHITGQRSQAMNTIRVTLNANLIERDLRKMRKQCT